MTYIFNQAVINAKLFIIIVCLFLMACASDSPTENMLEKYRSRLSNSLDLSLEPIPLPAVIEFPIRRQLEFELTSQSIDLLEFLELTPCRLQRLVGERNSSLGRFMSHTQQWIYEAEFIRQAQECIEVLSENFDNNDLKVTLKKVLADKLNQRAFVIWNAVWASREFQNSLSSTSNTLAPNTDKPTELIESFHRLNVTVSDWYNNGNPPGQQLELLYQVIGAEKTVGELLASVQMLRIYLENINVAYEQRLSGRPLCFNGQKNRKADILQNVFLKFYIGEVQPYIALIHQSAAPIVKSMAEINSVVNLTVEFSPHLAFNEYWQMAWSEQHPSQWQQFNLAVEKHTLLWQKQLAQCGLLPSE